MEHRHIKEMPKLTIAAIDDILERGSPNDWSILAKIVEADPYGETAKKLETVLANHYMYGTTIAWTGLLAKWRNQDYGQAMSVKKKEIESKALEMSQGY